MIKRLFLVSTMFFTCLSSAQPNAQDLLKKMSKLSFQAPQLSFRDFIDNYRSMASETALWREIYDDSSMLKQNSLSGHCDYQLATQINAVAGLALARDKLFTKRSEELTYDGFFYRLANGRSMYQHWLKSWLLSDVSIVELEQIAIEELKDAAHKRNLTVKNEGKYEAFIDGQDHQKIVSLFRKKEAAVFNHLDKYFPKLKSLSKVNIVRSSLPKSFPAPGIYDAYNQRFIYHLQKESFASKTMDWLYIHEAVPGHHYQSQFVQQHQACPQLPERFTTTAFSEGWAAYVEGFGAKLGLYQDSESTLYALDWQALRAVRVLLDIGMHAYGWSDEQAKSVWMKHIPEQSDIMEREIKRIRNWPAQVITYVYGKSVIQNYIEQTLAAKPKSLIEIHQEVLERSGYALSLLAKD